MSDVPAEAGVYGWQQHRQNDQGEHDGVRHRHVSCSVRFVRYGLRNKETIMPEAGAYRIFM
jgi:hypothetical protein